MAGVGWEFGEEDEAGGLGAD